MEPTSPTLTSKMGVLLARPVENPQEEQIIVTFHKKTVDSLADQLVDNKNGRATDKPMGNVVAQLELAELPKWPHRQE